MIWLSVIRNAKIHSPVYIQDAMSVPDDKIFLPITPSASSLQHYYAVLLCSYATINQLVCLSVIHPTGIVNEIAELIFLAGLQFEGLGKSAILGFLHSSIRRIPAVKIPEYGGLFGSVSGGGIQHERNFTHRSGFEILLL
jgi:hypothetical protein